ncbi:MAG: diguanylate cyclase, partial [Candidatus Thiodiazotropha sp.]
QLAIDIESRRRTEEALRGNRAQLQAIVDSLPIGIGWSRQGELEYVNRKFTEVFGYRLEEVSTIDQLYRHVFPDEAYREGVVKRWTRQVMAAKKAGSAPPPLEAPLVCKDGRVRYGMLNVSWIGDRSLVNFSDITDRWHAERHDQARNRILEMIAKGGSLKKTLDVLVGSVEEERPGMLCSILLLDKEGWHLHIGAAPSLPDFYNQAIDGLEIGDGVGSCGTAVFNQERVVVTDIPNHPYWDAFQDLAAQAGVASCWSEPVFSSKERILGTFAVYHRESRAPDEEDLRLIGQAANLASIAIEHHQTLAELERQAHIDSLTGLANRGRFMALAEAEQARAARYGKPFAVLLLDVDHFKSINDLYGHKAGDAVLRELGAILRKTLREVDIIGRIGGEEFAALLPETDAAQAPEVAERLRRAIADSEMPAGDGEPLHITVSIGVVVSTEHASYIDKLLSQADIALYQAKNNGRNRVSVAQTA